MIFADKQFYTLFGEALEVSDRDVYISDEALSSILWSDPEDPDTAPELTADLTDSLGNIWDVAHASIKDIRAITGLTQVKFATRYCIPRRSLEDWETDRAHCPDYLRLLLADAVGLLHVERKS